MVKKILFSLTILVLFLVSCAPRPSEPGVTRPSTEPRVTPSEEIPATGEAPVDAVAEDITNAGTVDEELDTGELQDVDAILSDIGNI